MAEHKVELPILENVEPKEEEMPKKKRKTAAKPAAPKKRKMKIEGGEVKLEPAKKKARQTSTKPKEKSVKKVKKSIKKTTAKKSKKTTKKKKKLVKKVKKRIPTKRSIIRSSRSSWICFLSDIRKQKLPEHVNLSFGELCRLLSPQWQKMSAEDKAPYVLEYKADRERFIRDMTDLTDAEKKILRAHKRMRRKARAGRPRSSLSAYMIFVSKERTNVVAENPELNFRDVGRNLGARWRCLSAEQKASYDALAQVDRDRYMQELTVWKNEEAVRKENLKQEAVRVKEEKTAAASAAKALKTEITAV